jgi:hypothetical protein
VASLPSLAAVSDVEERLGQDITDPAQITKVTAFLRDASIVVRNYCRRDFTLQTTTHRLRPRGSKVILPQRPVVSVWHVRSAISFGTSEQVTPMAYWRWVAGHEIHLGDQSLVINGPTLDFNDDQVWVEVVYQHGYAEVPDDVKSVVANMALRNHTVPGGGVIDSQTVGPYTTRYAGFVSTGPLSLAPGDREVLNAYRNSTSTTVELRG